MTRIVRTAYRYKRRQAEEAGGARGAGGGQGRRSGEGQQAGPTRVHPCHFKGFGQVGQDRVAAFGQHQHQASRGLACGQ